MCQELPSNRHTVLHQSRNHQRRRVLCHKLRFSNYDWYELKLRTRTKFMVVAASGKSGAVVALVAAGADVNTASSQGLTASMAMDSDRAHDDPRPTEERHRQFTGAERLLLQMLNYRQLDKACFFN